MSGHVRPAAVLRGMMNLEPLKQAGRFPGFKGFVQGRQPVGVQAVHDQDNPPAGKVDIRKVLQYPGKVPFGPAVRNLDMPPAFQGSMRHEQVGRSIALAFTIMTGRLAGPCRKRHPGFPDLLPRGPIQADRDFTIIKVPLADPRHILHGTDDIGILPGRCDPALPGPGLQVVSFNVRRTVSADMPSAISSSTRRSPSIRMVHSERPEGGFDQAGLINTASPSPSRRRFLRLTCSLRDRAAYPDLP